MKCPYFYVKCSCNDFICRGFFPKDQKKINPELASICRSPDYKTECLRYPDAVKYNTERLKERDTSTVCRFLAKMCAGCKDYMCKGGVPPFQITNYGEGKENHIESCRSINHRDCPHYKEGMDHIEEWKRVRGISVQTG